MSAKTDFVQSVIKDLPATYSNSLPIRGALITLAEAMFDAEGAMTPAALSVTDAKLANDVKVGSLATLTTTAKGSVVAAINELVTALAALNERVAALEA